VIHAGGLSYDRTVAKCYLEDGTDLAAELVKQGLALDWPKFSGGAYRHLEPEGIRKKHWRAAAKQQGKLPRRPRCRGNVKFL
jgi:micrococcal nuclease